MFDTNDDIEINWLNETFNSRDELHDALADATDGTNPTFYFEGVGYVTMIIQHKTGSTICEIDSEDYYLNELLDMLETEGVDYV